MQASSEEECFLLQCSGKSWMRGCRGCATSWAVSTGWDAGFRRPSAAAGGSAFDPARHRRGCTFAAQPLAPRPLLHCAGFKVVWAGRGQGFTTSPARDGQPWSGGGQVPCRRPAPPRSPSRRAQPWLLHRPHSGPGVPGAGGPPGAARNSTLLRRARAAPVGRPTDSTHALVARIARQEVVWAATRLRAPSRLGDAQLHSASHPTGLAAVQCAALTTAALARAAALLWLELAVGSGRA